MSGPRVEFLIGGVQKGGTTALAHFLSQHPQISLPKGKEAHVFDAPQFNDAWDVAQVDQQYAAHFAPTVAEPVLHGDATPIYCFHPRLVERIARYNPSMKWILLLRHPVERAVSQYQMEYRRGDERLPFWLAMVLERWRLRGHENDFSTGSPLRHFSYMARGDYATQLDVLYSRFPRDQVLVLRNDELASDPQRVLLCVHSFLQLEGETGPVEFGRVFQGNYEALPRTSLRFRLLSWMMRQQMERARHQYGISWS